MRRKRYMTKRRIEEKISRQRKVALFMVLAVMLTTVTLTYKNVNGDFSRLMGSAYTAKNECIKAGNKWYTRYSCIPNDKALEKETECKRLGGVWNKGYGCISSTLSKYIENCYNKGEALDFKKLESANLSNSNTYCSKSSELRVNTNKVELKGGEGFKIVSVPSTKGNKIEYSIENSKVASLNPKSGVVKAISSGTTKITVKDSKNNVSKIIEVSVSAKVVQDGLEPNDNNGNNSGGNSQTPNDNADNSDSNDTPEEREESKSGTITNSRLTVNSNNIVLYINKTYQLKVTSSVKSDKITYKSSDKNIAIVSSKGLIKGKKEGKATITITSSSGLKENVYVTVGKKIDLGVNYGPRMSVSINKDNKVLLNVVDSKIANVWIFDDKLNGNSIFEEKYDGKQSVNIEIDASKLPEKGKTKKYYVRTKDSTSIYSYSTFVVKNNNEKYNKSTGPTIKGIRGISINGEKYIAYTVSSNHGLSLIKYGEKNGELNKVTLPNKLQEYSNIVKIDDLTKSKNGYYYLWVHAVDSTKDKNYTRLNTQIKLK